MAPGCRFPAVGLQGVRADQPDDRHRAEADARLQQRQRQRQWQAWRVQRVEQESRDIRSFYLEPPASSTVAFAPGQHVPVQIQLDGEAALIRTYSLSSAPSDGYLRISVKAQASLAAPA